MQSLLFITPELPYPAQSGGKLKSLRLLEHLCSRYRVTLACPLKVDDASHLDAFIETMQGKLDHCVTQPVQVTRSAINLGKSYLRNEPINVLRTRSRQLKSQIDALPERFDLVLLDHYEVLQYLPENFAGTVIYHAHNAYHKMWERYADATPSLVLKATALAESVRVKRYERKVCQRADLTFAAPQDLTALRGSGARSTRMADTYHLGDDSQLALPDLTWSTTNLELVYVGYLGWEANIMGLIWFIEQVWPDLKTHKPGLTLKIVGKSPDARLQKLADQHADITLAGFVDDLETVYSTARVCIAPLTFGSGMKVKVLNAMARGIPVATTTIGAESIDADHGKHLMIARDASEMTAHIVRLLESEALWQRLCVYSRECVRAKYTWRALFAAMDREIDSVHATRQSASNRQSA